MKVRKGSIPLRCASRVTSLAGYKWDWRKSIVGASAMCSCIGRASGRALSSRNRQSAVYAADKRHERCGDRIRNVCWFSSHIICTSFLKGNAHRPGQAVGVLPIYKCARVCYIVVGAYGFVVVPNGVPFNGGVYFFLHRGGARHFGGGRLSLYVQLVVGVAAARCRLHVGIIFTFCRCVRKDSKEKSRHPAEKYSEYRLSLI